jgi:hypothetical protein
VQKRRAISCALILLTLLVLTQLSYSAASKLTTAPRAKLCVTEGTMEESPGGELRVGPPLEAKRGQAPRMQVRPGTIRIAASVAAALCGLFAEAIIWPIVRARLHLRE